MLFSSLFIFQHGKGMVVFRLRFFMMIFQDFFENFGFLISMKFCTRIINKKEGGGGGGYESAIAPDLFSKGQMTCHL